MVVIRRVRQSAVLLREKRKRGEWEEMYSKPYLTMLVCLSFLHARQWTPKERITSTLSVLSFTLFRICHVTLVLSSSPDIISFHLFYLIHHYSVTAEAPNFCFPKGVVVTLDCCWWERAPSHSDCLVVLIRDLLITGRRDQSEDIRKLITNPWTCTKLWNWIVEWCTYKQRREEDIKQKKIILFVDII